MNDKIIEEKIIIDDNQEIEVEDDDMMLNVAKIELSGFGLFVGGAALGVGLSGELEGTSKVATIIASGALTTFSIIKCAKYTRCILGLEKKDKVKKLELK